MLSKRRYRRTMNKYSAAKYKEKMRLVKYHSQHRDVFKGTYYMRKKQLQYQWINWLVKFILLAIVLGLFRWLAGLA